MPVSGLVITLSVDEAGQRSALAKLEADSRFTIGERKGNKVPVVLETESSAEDQSTWEELRSTPGVEFVALAYVDFSDLDEGSRPGQAPTVER